jgi:hypothetical protein
MNVVTKTIPLTQYQKDAKYFFDSIYKPMLARVTGGSAAQGYRFPSPKEANKEAWECAYLHAGLLPRNAVYSVTDTPPDPWASWRGSPTDPNLESRKKNIVKTYVVNIKTNQVYDHRIRYFVPEPWATQLGFTNARFAANMSPDW